MPLPGQFFDKWCMHYSMVFFGICSSQLFGFPFPFPIHHFLFNFHKLILQASRTFHMKHLLLPSLFCLLFQIIIIQRKVCSFSVVIASQSLIYFEQWGLWLLCPQFPPFFSFFFSHCCAKHKRPHQIQQFDNDQGAMRFNVDQ